MANHKTKVIVADDEQVIANSLAAILKKAGFDALAVYSGEMAIEMARDFQPDKLISDVFMTGITGIEASDSESYNAAIVPNTALLRAAADRGFNPGRVRCSGQAYRPRRLTG